MQRRSATLDDVAHEAGVSQQTVSRVLNRPDGVRANPRESDPRDAGAALCAEPFGAAAGGESRAFNWADYGVADAARAVANRRGGESHAGAHQLEVSIAMPERSDYASLQTRLDEFRAQHIRGAIISLPLESSIAERLVKENPDIACLFLDVSPETEVSCVRFDHRDGCGACVRHLWDSAIANLACWPGRKARSPPGCASVAGGSIASPGRKQAVTVFGDWSAASGWQKTFELLHLQPRISAIVVANDQMALGYSARWRSLIAPAQRHLGHRL
jgi:DNA-binding LacI/PurR family transcriptional regulator